MGFGGNEMDYTQEQLDKMLKDAIADATKGLFTEDELHRRVTSEVDRRVETGIQKGLETNKAKWQEELERKAKLTATEIADEKIKEQLKTIEQREREVARRANTLNAKDLLSEAGVPKDHYDKVLGMVVSDDAEATLNNVNSFVALFSETKTNLETQLKTELTKIPKPQTGSNDAVIDKAKFTAMPYAKKLEFKASHPEQYKSFIN